MFLNKLFISYKNLAIKRKMMIIIIGISGLALLLSGVVSIIYHYHRDRDNLLDNLSITTQIIGENTATSLELKDSKTILNSLKTLAANPSIELACVYDKSSIIFTSYNFSTQNTNNKLCPLELGNSAIYTVYIDNEFHIFRDILDKNNEKIGVIYMQSSNKILSSRTLQGILYLVFITIIILVISYFLSNIFQKTISLPISSLSNSLTSVAISSNYSVRTKKYYNDEIGVLANSFNMMIAEIDKSNKNLLESSEKEKAAKIAAEKANNTKSRFLSNMSHELRTPMHAILSYSDICSRKLANLNIKHDGNLGIDDIERCLKIISKSGDRLLLLINSLLDLSKLEASAYKFHYENYDIRKIIFNVKEEVESLLLKKNINICIEDGNINSNLEIDTQSITRVVWNLFSNAIKFSSNNSTITVKFIATTLPFDSQNNPESTIPALQINITDKGIGIPENELNDIFNQFTQSSKTESGAGGTGLGLSICREIILAHNGYIYVTNNKDGIGTTFSFILPLKQNITTEYS